MICPHPDCTGVHDNNKYSELCPAAMDRKREKDYTYYWSAKGYRNRARKEATEFARSTALDMAEWIDSGRLDQLVAETQASRDPLNFMISTFFREVFDLAEHCPAGVLLHNPAAP
jgi:hypothetical protein